MAFHRNRRLFTPIAIVLACTLTASVAGIAAADDTQSTPSGDSVLPRPAAADPQQRGAQAPIGAVVAGLTGEAAAQRAGAAADHFRELADQRTEAIRTTTSARTTATAAQDYLHTAWGTLFPQPEGQGIRATHSVFTGAGSVTHGGDVVYAPTALSPGGACMEMTTAYTSSGPLLWAWDWCGGNAGIGKVVDMDESFLATYTTTVNGLPAYSTDVHQTDAASNTWSAYLYNFATQAWDVFYTSSGSYDLPDPGFGWDVFEIYSTVDPATNQAWYCQSMAGKVFEASAIEVNIGGTWQPATPDTTYPMGQLPPGSDFDCPALTFSVVNPNDHWIARIAE